MNALHDRTVDGSTFASPSGAATAPRGPRPAVPVNAFRHVVRRNDAAVRIQMRLEAARDVHFEVDGRDFSIETIHAENSLKYSPRDACVVERIAIRLGAECIRFEPRGSDTAVEMNCKSGEPKIFASHVLMATGRRPNTDDLRLDSAGVAIDARGFVEVDDSLATSVPGIWPLGDRSSRGAFTHTGYNDYEIVAADILDGASRKVSDRIPGYGLFIDPPLGRVGFTEEQARAAGYRVRIGKRAMTQVGRAREKGETLGLMKVVVDRDTDRILGAAILGVGGDEAVQGVLEAMNAGVTATVFMPAVPTHPTVSELVPTILAQLQPQGLQSMPRPPRRYAHFLFAAIQSALTSSIAAAIASFNLIWVGGFLGHWLRSWAVAWIVMLPVVIAAAPAILRLSGFMTRPDAENVGD